MSMTIDIELTQDGKRWNFGKREVSIGRDPECDVRLTSDAYLMVSRRHAIVRLDTGEQLWIEDQNSFNGTLVNGRRITREPLNPGDMVRLGDDGPELRISLAPGAATGVVTGVTGVSTAEMGSVSATDQTPAPPTQYGAPARPQPTQYGASRTTGGVAPTARTPQPTQYSAGSQQAPPATQHSGPARTPPPTDYSARPQTGGFSTTSHTPAPSGISTHIPSAAGGLEAPAASSQMPAASYDELSPGEEAMLERKIAMMRNLLVFVIVLCVGLAGVVIYQGQEIRKTRETVNAMQRQAENAVGTFMPQLDTRLKHFDQRMDNFQEKMDQMDANMKKAEDHFVVRMDSEMPKIMDRYVQMKANELQRGANAKVQVR
jgi:hypothetical protein